MATGIELIAAERARKLKSGTRSTVKDAELTGGELLDAANCYFVAAQAGEELLSDDVAVEIIEDSWPFNGDPVISDDPVRNLVRAAALIAAEIDRLQGEKPKENTELKVYSPDPVHESSPEQDRPATGDELVALGFRKGNVLGQDIYDHDCGLIVTPGNGKWSFMSLHVAPFGYEELKKHIREYNSFDESERKVIEGVKNSVVAMAAASLFGK